MARWKRAQIYMGLASLFFVLAHSSVRVLKHMPVSELVFVRSLSAVVFALIYFTKVKKSPLGTMSRALFYRGAYGGIALALYFTTLTNIQFSSAVTINYLAPLLAVVWSFILLGEKPGFYSIVGLGLAFSGVLVIHGVDPSLELKYLLMALGAAFFAGLAYTYVRVASLKDEPMVIVFYLPLVVLLPSFIWMWPDAVWPNTFEVFWLTVMSLCVFAAQYLMTLSYSMEEVHNVSVPRYLTIFWAWVFGLVFFDEVFSLWGLLGVLLVFVGLLVSRRKITPKPNVIS